MLFILDAIQCAAEEAVMYVEEKAALFQEKRFIKRMSHREKEEEQNEDEEPSAGEDGTADDTLDDFDEYLRECALDMLSPSGTQIDLTSEAVAEERQDKNKDIIQTVTAKLPEEDQKEIIHFTESRDVSTANE